MTMRGCRCSVAWKERCLRESLLRFLVRAAAFLALLLLPSAVTLAFVPPSSGGSRCQAFLCSTHGTWERWHHNQGIVSPSLLVSGPIPGTWQLTLNPSSSSPRFDIVLWSSSPTSSSAVGTGDNKDEGINDNGNKEAPSIKKTFFQNAKAYFRPPNDGLTARQRLSKMGLAAVLSYGFVSNMSYCVTVSLAWYIFSKQTGLSPLAPGQWKGFLAIYAGFWVFNNIIRPIRLAGAVAISAPFERFVNAVQRRFKVSRPVAITLTVLIANLFGTTFVMCLGIAIAAALAGVPIFPR